MSDLPEYKIERVFSGPVHLVWRAWTEPEILSQWYGPGVETIIHKFDLVPGGSWLNEMKWGDKSDLSKMVFQEIVPEARLVWLHTSTDADWNDITHPMMEDWPLKILTIVDFEAVGDQTTVTLTLRPVDATETEISCFLENAPGFKKGWGSGFALMDDILAKMLTS
jgi:uncharacterized protein YndB with AHSA1/START domain